MILSTLPLYIQMLSTSAISSSRKMSHGGGLFKFSVAVIVWFVC